MIVTSIINCLFNLYDVPDSYFFGKNVTLTYKGDEKFRTLRGGLISIMYITGILYYTIDAFVPVFYKQIESYYQYENYINRATTSFSPYNGNFTFALGLQENLDPSIATFSF